MYFSSPEELKKFIPVRDGVWNKDYLYEYLVWHSNVRFEEYIDGFFRDYRSNEKLADLLFEFLLDDYYDGSDCQMGAAYFISKMDERLLLTKKELLVRAQSSEVYAKRPFTYREKPDWL